MPFHAYYLVVVFQSLYHRNFVQVYRITYVNHSIVAR